jgi:hypothetical protein
MQSGSVEPWARRRKVPGLFAGLPLAIDGRHFVFDLEESVAAAGEKSQVVAKSRGRVPPALALPKAGLHRCGQLSQEDQRESGITGIN